MDLQPQHILLETWNLAIREHEDSQLPEILHEWNQGHPDLPLGCQIKGNYYLLIDALRHWNICGYQLLMSDLEARQIPLHTIQDKTGADILMWLVWQSFDGFYEWSAQEIRRLLNQGFPIQHHAQRPTLQSVGACATAMGKIDLLNQVLPYYTLEHLQREQQDWLTSIHANRTVTAEQSQQIRDVIGQALAQKESQALEAVTDAPSLKIRARL